MNYRVELKSAEKHTLVILVQAINVDDAEIKALEKFEKNFSEYLSYNYEIYSVKTLNEKF